MYCILYFVVFKLLMSKNRIEEIIIKDKWFIELLMLNELF